MLLVHVKEGGGSKAWSVCDATGPHLGTCARSRQRAGDAADKTADRHLWSCGSDLGQGQHCTLGNGGQLAIDVGCGLVKEPFSARGTKGEPSVVLQTLSVP